jgi:hypothetical protein
VVDMKDRGCEYSMPDRDGVVDMRMSEG